MTISSLFKFSSLCPQTKQQPWLDFQNLPLMLNIKQENW